MAIPKASKKEKQSRELDTRRIAAAAMAIIDEHGVAGFSMRAVAKALNVTPMALYHHVKDRAGLAAILVYAAMREVALPPTTGDWREDLWAMSQWMRAITLAHPGVRHLRGEFQLITPTVLQMTERWLSLWQQSGLSFDKAVLAARSSTAITGFVMEELALGVAKFPDEETLAMLPKARAVLNRSDGGEEFELAARAVIDGIYGRLASSGEH